MKQKYIVNIADMELSIVSDASKEDIDNVVGILDRKMRDIASKSQNCTRSEAAILCALTYCSERLSLQDSFKSMEKDVFRLTAENEKLKKSLESTQQELTNIRKDANVMRDLLERSHINEDAITSTNPFQATSDQLNNELKQADIPVASIPVLNENEHVLTNAEEDKKNNQKKNNNKNRAGDMFDLLNFGDI